MNLIFWSWVLWIQSAWALNTQNPGVVEINKPSIYSQIIAMSDVHGMFENLKKLLTQAKLIDSQNHWVGGKTLLIITGDSIDKGPNSIGVLNLWMSLTLEAEKAGGRVLHLLGNHEAEFLAFGKKSFKSEAFLRELKNADLKPKKFVDGSDPRGQFLRNMPIAAKVGNWLFCHSGFYPAIRWNDFSAKAKKTLQDEDYNSTFVIGDDSILEAKDWWDSSKTRAELLKRLALDGMVGIVHGHQPKAYGLKHRIGSTENGKFIKLDVGMAPEAGQNRGAMLKFPKPEAFSSLSVPESQVILP